MRHIFLAFVSASVLAVTYGKLCACTLSPDQALRSNVAKALTKSDICFVFASAVWGKDNLSASDKDGPPCQDGMFRPQEGLIEVTTGDIRNLPIFDVWITAPSTNLSKQVGTWGFESQRYRLIFMLDFDCRNKLWLQDVESRVIRADWSIAFNERNPNWERVSDGEAQFGLNERIEEALKTMLVQKVAAAN